MGRKDNDNEEEEEEEEEEERKKFKLSTSSQLNRQTEMTIRTLIKKTVVCLMPRIDFTGCISEFLFFARVRGEEDPGQRL